MNRKIELNIPTEIDDITLGQYQQYLKLIEGLKESELVLNEFLKMKIVAIFCNVPFDLVRLGFKAKQVDKISLDIVKLLKNIDEDSKDFKPTFKIGKTKFGFINDLDGMMAGEYADLTSYFNGWDKMHKAMAVLYRPIIKERYNPLVSLKQYEISEYNGTEEYGELMKQMPAIKALQAAFFLANSFIKLQKAFLLYMGKQVENNPKLNMTLKANSMQIGDGIKAFTQLLDKTSLTLKG